MAFFVVDFSLRPLRKVPTSSKFYSRSRPSVSEGLFQQILRGFLRPVGLFFLLQRWLTAITALFLSVSEPHHCNTAMDPLLQGWGTHLIAETAVEERLLRKTAVDRR